MTAAAVPTDVSHRRVISAWRLVGGAYLHFAVPAYLVAMPLAAIFMAPARASIAAMVASVPRLSGLFLAGYFILAASSVFVAMGIEPLLRLRNARRAARDPNFAAQASSRRVARAIADGVLQLGPEAASMLDSFRGSRWDHANEGFQALSADLVEVVRTASAALTTAPPDRRIAIADLAAASLQRIDAALTALQAERSRLDEGDLHTVARYIATRYDSSDFAGDAH